MVDRIVKPLNNNSFFLFGARGTGKTYLLRRLLDPKTTLEINLLEAEQEERLALEPDYLHSKIKAFKGELSTVFIDEVQKIPKLLDVVHDVIEKRKDIRFALSGSSARKLRRGSANLLAGRAFQYFLFPFTHLELQNHFKLEDALRWGTLPTQIELENEQEKELYLRTYAQTYLQQEIVMAQVVRKLLPFRRFLEVAAQSNGQLINFSNIARDVGADTKTVQSYFQILEDTLIGFMLQPFHESIRKRQRSAPKFYFFDNGVAHALSKSLRIPLKEGTYAYGKAFENFIINEIQRLCTYLEPDYQLSYLQTEDDAEIDLIIERPGLPRALIEIKSKKRVSRTDLRHIIQLSKSIPNSQAYCFSQDINSLSIENVKCLPWQTGIQELGLTDE